MKRFACWSVGLVAAGALAVGPAVAAFGADNYGSMPGYGVSMSHTSCAGHGSFGAFGADFNFGNTTSGHVPYPGNATNGNGADGPATGYNNSNLCGNPQGNP